MRWKKSPPKPKKTPKFNTRIAKNMKKIISFVLAATLLSLCAVSFSSCAVPALEDVYDRVVSLVEASYEINAIFYGVGMPVYQSDSEYVQNKHLYYDYNQTEYYEYVTEYAKYPSEDAVMRAAQKVYSKGFLEDVLAVSAFTGYAIEDGIGGTLIARARYVEDNDWFCQSTDPTNTRYTAMRVYDYSTMQVHSLGRSDACTVTMESWLEATPSQVQTVEIYLIQQDGEWFLDSFTGA